MISHFEIINKIIICGVLNKLAFRNILSTTCLKVELFCNILFLARLLEFVRTSKEKTVPLENGRHR